MGSPVETFVRVLSSALCLAWLGNLPIHLAELELAVHLDFCSGLVTADRIKIRSVQLWRKPVV